MGVIIGYDTSCYTTSAAAVDTEGQLISSRRRLLEVKSGSCGLRQSEALFQHVRALPDIISAVMDDIKNALPEETSRIMAICVSAKPRDYEDSYMPVFLAGVSSARAMAAGLSVPCYETTHQLGHIYAGMVDLSEKDTASEAVLALHLSGGTTEALLMNEGKVSLLGGTSDLHAGQFVDRIGVALGLRFPAGAALEEMALRADMGDDFSALRLPSSVKGTTVSFSGAESQAQRLIDAGIYAPEQIAHAVFSCLSRTVYKLIENSILASNALLSGASSTIAVIVGGVGGSRLLKQELSDRIKKRRLNIKLHFANPELSGDNAVGVALIGRELYAKTERV